MLANLCELKQSNLNETRKSQCKSRILNADLSIARRGLYLMSSNALFQSVPGLK